MNNFEDIYKLALPYLRKGRMKDIVHTRTVIKAMELLLEKEKGDREILIPAAILHDIGWSKVPKELKRSKRGMTDEDKTKALKLHLKYAPEIIEEILTKAGCKKKNIERIIGVVVAHKFQEPKELDKKLLIDADTMSDAFSEQFYVDCKEFGKAPKETYDYRKGNKFYTKTASEIFKREIGKRRKEIEG